MLIHVGGVLQQVVRCLRDQQVTDSGREKAEQILMGLREGKKVGNAALSALRQSLRAGA